MQRWNIQYLHELYNKYFKLSIDTEDPTLSLQYESTANSVLDIIDRYDELVSKKRLSLDEIELPNHKTMVQSDFATISRYGYYCPYVRELAQYNDLLIIKPNLKLPFINVGVSRIISVSKDFYSQFNGVFAERFRLLESRFNDTLHFRKISSNTITAGQTYSVYKTDLTFFELGYNNTSQDYVSAIHEFGHGISCSINPDAMFDFEKYCFIEVDSLFFELLGTDYIGEVLGNKKDSYDISVQVFKDYIYSAMLITTKLDMYSENDRYNLNNKRFVRTYLSKTVRLDKIGVNDVLKTSIRDCLHYIISYLTAIELYLIYKSDQSTALDLLFKIITRVDNSSKDYLEYIKSLGLEPGKNIDTYVELLFNKAKDFRDDKSLRYKN